jgi:CDP-diacylglycerol--glycerol-3-phosphate 3-phosphatidyltransferase
MDEVCSLGLLAFLVTLVVTHAVRARGAQHHVRVDREGASALLSRGMLESLYAAIVPVGRLCERVGLTPNAITGLSVLLALGAGAAFAADHLGLGSFLAVVALGMDAVDGFVARSTGTASNAGEVIDAAADRYVELSLFGGLAVHLRQEPSALLIVIAALAGSYMISYSTAKAEALSVAPPRGSMRRTERGFLLIVGAALTPLSLSVGVPVRWAEAPLLLALVWLAFGTNLSAIARFSFIVRALRARDERHSVAADGAVEPLPGSCVDP